MADYADEILSVLNDLNNAMKEDIFEAEPDVLMEAENSEPETSGSGEPTAKPTLPDGMAWFSDRFPWTPDFGDFPIHVYGDKREIPKYWNWDPVRKQTEDLMIAVENQHNIRAIGWPGTGKTELGKICAALTGRQYLRIICDNRMELDQLLGSPGLKDGNTYFNEGMMPKAIRESTWITLDEVSATPSAVYQALFQELLEGGRTLSIKDTGELIVAHEGVVLFGADNARGLGDNQDKFPTRNVQDISTLNRWNITVEVDYMPPNQLADMLKAKYPKVHKNTAKKVAEFAKLCQDAFKKGEIPLAFSVRQAFTLVEHAMRVNSIERAVRAVFVNTLEPVEQEVVLGFMNSVWTKA